MTRGFPVDPLYRAMTLVLFSAGSTISTSRPSLSHSWAMRRPISDSSPVTLRVLMSFCMKATISSL